ncbi:DUF397 domain-containing protein [Streptomyces sp. NPDC004610]|uniref:DUF397 domain-containing protein n=1 Tax=unclassified Streptomyces TaxID=2593676 RepID=UPI0033B40842
MRPIDPTTCTWRKSSHSNGDGGQCLEVTDDLPAFVPVRDSKTPQGPPSSSENPPGPRSPHPSGSGPRLTPPSAEPRTLASVPDQAPPRGTRQPQPPTRWPSHPGARRPGPPSRTRARDPPCPPARPRRGFPTAAAPRPPDEPARCGSPGPPRPRPGPTRPDRPSPASPPVRHATCTLLSTFRRIPRSSGNRRLRPRPNPLLPG